MEFTAAELSDLLNEPIAEVDADTTRPNVTPWNLLQLAIYRDTQSLPTISPYSIIRLFHNFRWVAELKMDATKVAPAGQSKLSCLFGDSDPASLSWDYEYPISLGH